MSTTQKQAIFFRRDANKTVVIELGAKKTLQTEKAFN